jgi:outer membrane autotransporter protein
MTQKHSSAWAAKITCFLVWWLLTGLLPLHAMAAIQIRVSTPSAGTLRLDVESSDSIEALRQKIQDRIGIVPHQQTLSFDSTTLQDGRTLADYNVQHDSLLVLTWPVRREDLSSNVPIQQQLSAQAFATDLFITGQRNNIFNHLNHARSSQYNANQLRLAIDAPPQRHAKLPENQYSNQPILLDTANIAPLDTFNENMTELLSSKVWVSGDVDYASINLMGDKNSFQSKGITLGVDQRIFDDLIIGAAAGYGFNESELDNMENNIKSNQKTGTVYLSYLTKSNFNFDALVGYGDLKFDQQRYSDGLLTGVRAGNSMFSSIKLSRVLSVNDFRFQPYLKADLSESRLHAYSEMGSSQAAAYDKANIRSNSVSTGLNVSYPIPLSRGTLVPSMRMEYTRNNQGDLDQRLYYAQTAGNRSDFALAGRPNEYGVFGMGLNFSAYSNIGINLNYTYSQGSNAYQSNHLGAQMHIAF